ncbi:unnamed protein product [Mytilus coruscus]|uniref:Uncharacterized protein n=1 Tax=Mytilus coruscus TaxID=42192 RepID=A0A6J8E8X4_MYTCO|nr:unnamed protein product [Mytilus coruscus]
MVEVIDELGNPFMEDSQDLLVLDTKDIAPTSVVDTIHQIETIGKTNIEPEWENASRNQIGTLSKCLEPLKTTTDDVPEVDVLVIDGAAIVNMLRPSTSRNQIGSLSKCLEPLTTTTGDVPEVDVLVIDGAAIVNMLRPSTSRTFDDYPDLVFCPYIKKHLETVTRVDVVWDAYIDNSLKAATRSKMVKGIRRRVQGQNKIPQNWQSFLRDDDNKKELFSFLSQQLA